jgi:RNA recognition motif-containing protein
MQGGTRPSGAWERSAPGDNGRKTSNEHKQQGFPQSQPRRNSFRKSRRTSDASQGLEPFPEYVDADHQGQFAVEQPAPDVKYWSSKHHIGLGADDVTCLWVGGISPDVFEDQLKEIFSQAGPVEITSIRHDIQKKMRVCFVK